MGTAEMRAELSIKPATDPYSAIATAGLYGAELPFIRVINPVVDALNPNAAGLSPTNPRVVQWPTYGCYVAGNLIGSILGGTSLTGFVWYYEPATSQWYRAGNGFTGGLALAIGGAQGAPAVAMHAPKPTYVQITAVVGAVTDFFYGLI